MWTRAQLKARAKIILRQNYWRAFIMSLILLIAGASYANINHSNSNSNKNNNVHNNTVTETKILNVYQYGTNQQHSSEYNYVANNFLSFPGNFFQGIVSFVSSLLKIGILIAAIAFFVFRILFGYGLQVGGRKYFISAAKDPRVDFKCLSLAFKDGNFVNVLVTMLLRDVYTFLWSLLFVIPGIVKGLAYTMVPYILAENPKMSSSRAIQLSTQMTDGHKWKIFILKLSFLGWYILGNIAFLVGVAFVYPYENATFAELYITLRQDSINNGETSIEELS